MTRSKQLQIKKCYETIGKPEQGGHYSKQVINCFTANKTVTLTAQMSGVVVCSDWKKCEKHRQRGVDHCPILVAEVVLLGERAKAGGKRLRFVD